MRTIATVVDQINTLIPNVPPAELASELLVLQAELKIIKRTSLYAAPEAAQTEALWGRLSTALYRYLPDPAGYAFAQQISTLVAG